MRQSTGECPITDPVSVTYKPLCSLEIEGTIVECAEDAVLIFKSKDSFTSQRKVEQGLRKVKMAGHKFPPLMCKKLICFCLISQSKLVNNTDHNTLFLRQDIL